MYQGTETAKLDRQATEFETILKRLEEESSRFYNHSNELLRKADGLMRFGDQTQSPEVKATEPTS